jgi:DNA-binding MarR family transcriptional regulator
VPQRVDAWQWTQLILSEHAPSGQSHRLVLLAIAAHALASQTEAWPSQATIARRAQLSPRQVQRILPMLEAASWVLRSEVAATGQAWRRTVYHFVVPDGLPLPARPQRRGDNYASSRSGGQRHPRGVDVHMSPRSAGVPTSGTPRDDISGGNVTTFTRNVSTSKRRTNLPLEGSTEGSNGAPNSAGGLETKTRRPLTLTEVQIARRAGCTDAQAIALRCGRDVTEVEALLAGAPA